MSSKARWVASCFLVAMIAFAISSASGQQRRGRTVNTDLLKKELAGLEVGAKAPDVKLKDQEGKEVELKELLKKSELTALVFHRSADW